MCAYAGGGGVCTYIEEEEEEYVYIEEEEEEYICISTHEWRTTQASFTQMHEEFSFTTAGNKIVGNCRCIVPTFINDGLIHYSRNSLVPDYQNFLNFQKL